MHIIIILTSGDMTLKGSVTVCTINRLTCIDKSIFPTSLEVSGDPLTKVNLILQKWLNFTLLF